VHFGEVSVLDMMHVVGAMSSLYIVFTVVPYNEVSNLQAHDN